MLEPVLELAVTLDVSCIVEVAQERQLTLQLVDRTDHHEARDHVLALENAAALCDERAVERQIAAWCQIAQHLVDDGLAGVEVDRCAGDRQRVDALRSQRRIDRRQPAPWQSPIRFTRPPA